MSTKKLFDEIGMINDDIIQEANITESDSSILFNSKIGRKNLILKLKRFGVSFAAAFILFVSTVNLFPKVAYAMMNIPGLENLVKAVMFDKSLIKAVENEYYQYVNESFTKDNITVTVDYMIVDASRISIFCRIDKPENARLYNFTMLAGSIDQESGGDLIDLPGSANASDLLFSDNELKEIRIDVAENTSIPDKLIVNLMYKTEEDTMTELTMNLYPDDKYSKIVNSVDFDLKYEIEGQTLIIDRLDIYPTQAKLIFKTHPTNTAVFNDLDIYFEDSNGETYYYAGSATSDNSEIQSKWFDSCYFTEETQLKMYITGYSIIQKENIYGEIDYKNKTISNIPENVSVESMTMNGSNMEIILKCKSDKVNHAYDVAYFTCNNEDDLYASTVDSMIIIVNWKPGDLNIYSKDDEYTFFKRLTLVNYEEGKYQIEWLHAPMIHLEDRIIAEITLK